MDLLQSILQAGGGAAVQQLAASHGLSGGQVESVLAQLVPALAGGFAQNTQQEGGLDGLLNALAGGHHEQYVEDPATVTAPEAVDDGNGILGHIFGSKEVSREVASRASASTGVGADIIKKMLPMVAALAMGAMSKRANQASATGTSGDLLQDALGGVLGGTGGLGNILGETSEQAMAPVKAGGSILDMLTPMLDSNQNGSMADDVMGMLGKMMGGSR